MVRNLAMACLLTLAGLLPGAAALRSEAQTVDLTMIDYKFIPDHLTFVHGIHYRLHLENHGRETHELTAPTFFGGRHSGRIPTSDLIFIVVHIERKEMDEHQD